MKLRVRHITYIFLASVLLFVQGCIFDDADLCQDALPDNIVGYISIKLEPADGITRAVGDQFEYGKRDEFTLAPGNHHFILFYNDEQAAPVAVSVLSGSSIVDREGVENGTRTVAFAAIAGRTEQEDFLNKLQECFVILNADLNADRLWTMPKEQLLRTIVESPYLKDDKGNRYFTMCNAVYVDNGQLSVAADVDPSKVYSSYLEAVENAWNGESAVVAYVERLAAKVSLRFEQEAYNDTAAERIFTPEENEIILLSHVSHDIPYYKGGYPIKVKITGWGMNALEQESYLFRNIDPAGNYFNGWYGNKRAYWSEDCNYNAAVYPWQFRKAVDKESIPYYKGNDNILRNVSFNELNTNLFGKDNGRYAPENTFDFKDSGFKTTLDSRPELLAGTHVIVCAELLSDLGDNTFKANDLYRDRNGNFYRNVLDCMKALVSALNNTIQSSSYLKYTYYDWDNGGGEQTLFAKTNGEYALYYNNVKLTADNIDQLADKMTSDATVEGGDGQRIMWMDGMSIKAPSGAEVEIYSNIDEVDPNKNVWLRGATVSDIKSLLFEYVGVIDHFKDGKMYYAVPVGYVRDDNNSSADNDVYSIYGVVRNCVYDIVIHDVTGLGTSVDNDTEPIVPNKVSTHDHLYISFDILRWHETDQNVPGVIS